MGDRRLVPAHYYRELRIIEMQSIGFSVVLVGGVWTLIHWIKKKRR